MIPNLFFELTYFRVVSIWAKALTRFLSESSSKSLIEFLNAVSLLKLNFFTSTAIAESLCFITNSELRVSFGTISLDGVISSNICLESFSI